MKLIKNLDQNNSTFAGKRKSFVEFSFRPSAKVDANGNPLSQKQRYYVLRPLSFENEEYGRTDYPFIIREEHVSIKRNADDKVISVETITCPTTSWAAERLRKEGEPIGKGYCPICDYSFQKNGEAWANRGHIDKVAAKLANETQRIWAAYIPVYVVSDPHYPNNNKHLRVLRISSRSGAKDDRKAAQDTFQHIINKLEKCIKAGINVFNGEEGANLWVLCEAVKKTRLNKDGTPSIDKKTGAPYEYTSWDVTDVRMGTNKLHAYPDITDEAIEELDFDGNYNVASKRSALEKFLRNNWLDIGASASDAFDVGELPSDDFDSPAKDGVANDATQKAGTLQPTDAIMEPAESSIEGEAPAGYDFDNDDNEETAASVISSIVGSKPQSSAPLKRAAQPTVVKATAMPLPKDTEKLRNETANTAFDDSDLPF